MSKSLNLVIGAAGVATTALVVSMLPDGAATTGQPPFMSAAAGESAKPQTFGLGRPALPEEIAAWDIDVKPDGTGLPPGSGDALTGEPLFEEHCAICHGSFAEGVGNWPKLAGGDGTLADEDPLKTVGSYWPYLSTVWDYVHRSMPFGNAQSLSHDDVYAITAYILYSNDLIDYEFVLDQDSLAAFVMPNADGFIVDDRAETEYPVWSGEPCMENCKDSVEITMRARVLDVTPEDDGATEAAMTDDQGAADIGTAAADPETDTAQADAPDPELVAAGEKVFKKCKACHQVGEGAKNRSGPHLNGVMGRPVATVDGFKYSKVLKALGQDGVVWDAETLDAFLADPKGYAKGTKMSFKGLKKAEDLAAIQAYLSTFTE